MVQKKIIWKTISVEALNLNTYVRPVCIVPLCCYWLVYQSRTVTQPKLLIQISTLFVFNILIISSKTCPFGSRLPFNSAFGVRGKKKTQAYCVFIYGIRLYAVIKALDLWEQDPTFLEASLRIMASFYLLVPYQLAMQPFVGLGFPHQQPPSTKIDSGFTCKCDFPVHHLAYWDHIGLLYPRTSCRFLLICTYDITEFIILIFD
jgi:hypothetical protein